MQEDIASEGLSFIIYCWIAIINNTTHTDCAEMLAEAILLNAIDHDSLFLAKLR